MATLQNTEITGNSFLELPAGTTAERPGSPVTGMVRFNTELGVLETWTGSAWASAVQRKDGKIHWEIWNRAGWAYNEKVITHWAKIFPPKK